MTSLDLRQEDLDLGGIAALATSPDGQRIYLGRRFSGDQARANVAVLTRGGVPSRRRKGKRPVCVEKNKGEKKAAPHPRGAAERAQAGGDRRG